MPNPASRRRAAASSSSGSSTNHLQNNNSHVGSSGSSGRSGTQSTRTAAIQAAERRRRQEQQQCPPPLELLPNEQQPQQQEQQQLLAATTTAKGKDLMSARAAGDTLTSRLSEALATASATVGAVVAAASAMPSNGIMYDQRNQISAVNNSSGINNLNTKGTDSVQHRDTPTQKHYIKKYLPPYSSSSLAAASTFASGGSNTAATAATATNTATSSMIPMKCPNDDGRNSNIWNYNSAQSATTVLANRAAPKHGSFQDDDDEEDDEEDEGCLHCHRKVKRLPPKIRILKDGSEGCETADNGDDDEHDGGGVRHGPATVQVRCDDCQAYICTACHWCHEFQANHEVRVCDRCDAFYCRTCDEMDQCDDCGEVVCGSCSTLLSCKFCGGGLCDECATACGRCGIVLCSRDAKFAVDCDTCRLSYCLVCLASGSKDPCVRCGHRPSKRMEQLVHLRLKSIYKAFKSSSNNGGNIAGPTGVGGADGMNSNLINTQAIAGAGNAHRNSTSSNSSSNNKQSYHHGQRRNKPTTLQDMVGDDDDDDGAVVVDMMDFADDDDYDREDDDVDDNNNGPIHGSGEAYHSGRMNYIDGASSSNNRPYYGDVNGGGMGTDSEAYANSMSMMMGGMLPPKVCRDLAQDFFDQQYFDQLKKADAAAEALLAELQEEEEAKAQKMSKKKKKKARKAAAAGTTNSDNNDNDNDNEQNQQQGDDAVMTDNDAKQGETAPTEDDLDAKKNISRRKESSSDSGGGVERQAVGTRSNEPHSRADEDEDNALGDVDKVKMDPIEKELVEYVEQGHIEGIEDILFRIKGVPGRAALRKNAKKALKRLRMELQPPTTDGPIPAESIGTVKEQPWQSISPNKASMISSEVAASKTTAAAKTLKSTTKVPHTRSSVQASAVTPRAESTIQISATLVGWIIGKGGQRIRDLMEESGAKIWIDQEKVKGQAIRNVYISGNHECVEHGMKLVKEVVANAPPPPGSTATTATTAVPVSGPSGPISVPPIAASAEPPTKQKVSVIETIADRLKESTKTNSAVAVHYPSAWELSKDTEPHTLAIQNASAHLSIPVDPTSAKPTNTMTTHPQGSEIDTFSEVVDCDPRFVPLLIGRRGWTIKHIQDESGARVDIDQTVTPRRVRISGIQANVEKAVAMVRDVLAYPHAQLLCPPGGAEENIDNPLMLSNIEGTNHDGLPVTQAPTFTAHLMTASALLEDEAEKNVPSFLVRDPDRTDQTDDRNQSPPPIVGDAKSAISASSSLSSTPEPSMASSSKGLLAASQLQNVQSMPSNPKQYSTVDSYPATNPFQQPQIPMVDANASRGYLTSASAGVAAAPHAVYGQADGHMGMHGARVPPPLGSGTHESQHQIYTQPSNPPLQMGKGMLQIPHHLRHHHQTPYDPHQHASAFGPPFQMEQRMQFPTTASSSPMADATGQFDHFGNSPQGFHATSTNAGYNHFPAFISSAQAVASMPLRDQMSDSMGRGGPTASLSMRPSDYGAGSGSAFWNSGAPSYPSSRVQAPRLPPVTPTGYSTNSLGFAPQHYRPQRPQAQPRQSQPPEVTVAAELSFHRSGVIRQQAQLPQQQSNKEDSSDFRFSSPFAASAQSVPKNDDSIMIDSLFGGTSAGTAGNRSDLLTGFNGLSLAELEPATSSGLWGPSSLSETWDPTDDKINYNNMPGNSDNVVGGAAKSSSSIGQLFTGPMPTLSEDHPHQSRFNWSSNNA